MTLQEELDYIRVYMEIYRKRFPDKFQLEIEAGESELAVMIPKLTLQPIVENAIKHGLRNKVGKGKIRIFAEGEDDLKILIEDNGEGMEESQLQDLLEKIHDMAGREDHVGLANIQERLEISGGKGYGIVKIETKKGMYFRIWLRIKKGWDNV